MPKAKKSSIEMEEVRPVPKARNSVKTPPSPSKRNPGFSKSSIKGSSSSRRSPQSTSPVPRPRRQNSRSWAEAQASFEEVVFGNGNLNNDDAMIEFSDDEEETTAVVANADDPKLSTASKAMKKFVTGLVDLYTIIGKDPVVIGHSIFRRMMVTLHVTLTYGYYLGVIPFKISDKDGSYKYETFFPQQIFAWSMQMVCVCVLTINAFISIVNVDILLKPNSLCAAMTKSMAVLLALSFVYAVSFRGRRFFNIFSSFNRRICLADRKKQIQWKVALLQMMPLIVYFAFSNWKTWGIHILSKNILIDIYKNALSIFLLPDLDGEFYFYFINSIYIGFSMFTDLLTYYVHALLWAGACTVYICEKLSRKVTLESKQPFFLAEATILLNNQRILMRKLNLALGPIIVVFYIEVIPFLVYTICQMSLQPRNFPWAEVAMIPLKLGHIFIACEACSNADDLVYDILVKKVEAIPPEIKKIPNRAARTHYLTEYGLMVDKFRDIVQRAICLRAMDYFAVNYGLIGGVTQWLITSALLIADWSRDSGKGTLEEALEKYCDKKNCKVSFIVTHDNEPVAKKKK